MKWRPTGRQRHGSMSGSGSFGAQASGRKPKVWSFATPSFCFPSRSFFLWPVVPSPPKADGSRVDTTRTLAASLVPPRPAATSAPSLDAAIDPLLARQMLAREPWGTQWRRRDPLGFTRAAARVAGTANDFVTASSRIAPEARDAWWAAAREALRSAAGPGAKEAGLARLALE